MAERPTPTVICSLLAEKGVQTTLAALDAGSIITKPTAGVGGFLRESEHELGLNQLCALEVREATTGRRMLPGLALIAPGGRHTLVKRSGASRPTTTTASSRSRARQSHAPRALLGPRPSAHASPTRWMATPRSSASE